MRPATTRAETLRSHSRAERPSVYSLESISMLDGTPTRLGHNIADIEVGVEVRFFNAIARYAGPQGRRQKLTVPAGTTVGELADRLGVPRKELFLVLVNGRDITPGLVGDDIKDYHVLDDGDVIALSGAVPYSYGYGSPVV
jgi:hypothetical protein